MKFIVTIPLPESTTYQINASYPEAAKREASKRHRYLLPKLSVAEIALMASCHRENPGSYGGRYKKETFIEQIYRRLF